MRKDWWQVFRLAAFPWGIEEESMWVDYWQSFHDGVACGGDGESMHPVCMALVYQQFLHAGWGGMQD
jgi:hypothetical protein